MNSRVKIRKLFWLLLALPVFPSCKEEGPLIHALDPPIGMLGETLHIRGENFGPEQGESYVSIAGIAPTGSSYLHWDDTLISLRLSEFGESGVVRVHVGGKRSNALLFSNRATMPAPVSGEDFGIGPRISAVSPSAAQVGSLVSIEGSGFGSSRERSGVFFSWDAESLPGTPIETRSPGFIEVFEADYGYELWSEREIRVRVPDGAVSGNVEIRTPRGSSRPVFFEVAGKPGTKTFRNKRSYSFTYSVDVRVLEALSPNILYLWIPRPAVSASQRNPEVLSRNTDSFVENYRGTDLFQLVNLSPNSSAEIRQTWLVEVYAQETNLRYQQIKQDSSSPVYGAYTQATSLVPAADPRVKALAETICGRERNPYLKARRIYEWLLMEGNIGPWDGEAAGVLDALDKQRCDPYTGALLFCSLARAAGVPALPVSGVLVSRGEALRHYWAEFWIDGFGWVPLDPALGAGAAPEGFSLRDDATSWYFGNLDNQRIAFSRGQTILSQMDPRGRTVSRNRDYALQNLWEEAVGGLESYSSLWGDINITGTYAQ
ncbi:MAG: transcription factor [Treponema sp.]|jgi:transglutaminase-like putative cysteine protease|nr:transcription factor [Treponema sp.]